MLPAFKATVDARQDLMEEISNRLSQGESLRTILAALNSSEKRQSRAHLPLDAAGTYAALRQQYLDELSGAAQHSHRNGYVARAGEPASGVRNCLEARQAARSIHFLLLVAWISFVIAQSASRFQPSLRDLGHTGNAYPAVPAGYSQSRLTALRIIGRKEKRNSR